MKLTGTTALTIFVYGIALAGAAFLLQLLEYQHFLKSYPTEIYILLIAVGFAALGIWVGYQLTRKEPASVFQRNDAAIASLGLTSREFEVLQHLAAGQSNKEIARNLKISPNTIKTHVSSIFQKLKVERRLQAVKTARELHLVP